MFSLRDDLEVLSSSCLALCLSAESASGVHTLSSGSDFFDAFHGLHGRGHEVPVVFDRCVPSLGELRKKEVLVNDHFLATESARRLGPLEFTGLSLHLEVLVAFGAAESEDFCIVANECYSFGRVHWARAQMACFDPKFISYQDRENGNEITVPHGGDTAQEAVAGSALENRNKCDTYRACKYRLQGKLGVAESGNTNRMFVVRRREVLYIDVAEKPADLENLCQGRFQPMISRCLIQEV